MIPEHTTVAIVGGGPAGLLLARLLHLRGVDCVVLESRDRAYVEQRQRAGILEQGTVDVLRAAGAESASTAKGSSTTASNCASTAVRTASTSPRSPTVRASPCTRRPRS